MTSRETLPPAGGPRVSGPQFAAPGTFGPPAEPGAFAAPQPAWSPPPGTGPGPVTDEQLRRLPPPLPGGPDPRFAAASRPVPPARPVVVGLATTLAVTAALLWVCALSLAWVLAVAASGTLDRGGSDGVVFHLLDRFGDRMLDGLALPLYLFPLASLVTGFLLLNGRRWSRLAHTVVGASAVAWTAWWLRGSLLAWAPVAVYVTVAVAVLWTPAANRWYARRAAPR